MLLRHSAYYLLARGVPGIVNFGAIALYTRLLSPYEFGQYSIVVATVGLINIFFFQWLRLVVGRFLRACQEDPRQFLSGILALFLILAVALTGCGVTLALWWPDEIGRAILAFAVPLMLTQAWFELNLAIANAQVQPGLYGRLLGSRSVLAAAVGVSLAWFGLGVKAPLIGLIVGHAVAFTAFGLTAWKSIKPRWPSRQVFHNHLRYGLPLTLTFALSWVVSGSDRLLLAWLVDTDAVGLYTPGYDLAFQGITLILSIVNTAAYPLAVAALEEKGEAQAREQLSLNGELITILAVVTSMSLIALRVPLCHIFIGETFRAGAVGIFPWITVAAAIAGIRAYYFDLSFHLGKRSQGLILVIAVAAGINLLLNLLLIPHFGIYGASWATLGGFLAGLVMSIIGGRDCFELPSIARAMFQGAMIGAVSVLVIYGVLEAVTTVYAQIVIAPTLAALAIGLCSWLFDACFARAHLSRLWGRLRG